MLELQAGRPSRSGTAGMTPGRLEMNRYLGRDI
jgi:hypothetical protein